MNDVEKYPIIYQDLFVKTEELFGFIEEQKKLQLQIIGLMKGINDSPEESKTSNNDLTLAITNLACELKKSVESQKSIQCNLNDVLQSITSQSGVQVNMEILNHLCGDDNDDRTIPQITNISNTPSPNRLSPNRDITEINSIPDYDKCISKSTTKSKNDDCRKSQCFSTLREDFKIMSKPNMYIYVLDMFCKRLAEELEDWSEPFYTSHVGYRMVAKIGFCKDYLGIYIKLVEGDFDDLLAWPFRSEIAFTLLNQVNEDKSITKILKPHPCDPDEYGYWIKPKYLNSCLGGWGFNNFIELCVIKGPNNDYISEYLRNNIIYIKIKLIE